MGASPYTWRDSGQVESQPGFVRRAHPVDYWAVVLWSVLISGGILAVYGAWTLVQVL